MHIRRFGDGPELVALHGFSLTGEQFSPLASRLSRTIVAPDLPGHGHSRGLPCDIDSVVANIEALLDPPGGPRPLLGYSQGARLALVSAVESPDDLSALVLISANAGIEDADERVARTNRDEELAERIESIGVDAFVDSWTTAGITSLDHLGADYRAWDRSVRSENSASGLAGALRGYGQGAQPSLWNDLDQLHIPVLLIVGERDDRYRSINERMAGLIPAAELHAISGTGHNPLADDPDATTAVVSEFLDRHC